MLQSQEEVAAAGVVDLIQTAWPKSGVKAEKGVEVAQGFDGAGTDVAFKKEHPPLLRGEGIEPRLELLRVKPHGADAKAVPHACEAFVRPDAPGTDVVVVGGNGAVHRVAQNGDPAKVGVMGVGAGGDAGWMFAFGDLGGIGGLPQVIGGVFPADLIGAGGSKPIGIPLGPACPIVLLVEVMQFFARRGKNPRVLAKVPGQPSGPRFLGTDNEEMGRWGHGGRQSHDG